jgi:chromosome segregation ATPase
VASLKELVEQASRTPLDALRQLDTHEKRVRSEIDSAKQRLATTEKELEFSRPVREALRDRVEALKRDVESLEKHLQAQKLQLQRASDEHQEKTEQASQFRKDRSLAETAAQESEKRLRDLEEQTKRAKLAILAAQKAALRGYLETTGKRLIQFAEMQDKSKAGQAALERLKAERNSSAQVASLCEAREELKRILAEVRVPSVVSAMRSQLDDAERRIEALFPGAIAAESQQTGEELEEIYFATLPNSRARLFLPLAHDVWRKMDDGGTGVPEDTAVRMVWALQKSIKADWGQSEAQYIPELGVIVDAADCPDLADVTVNVPIGRASSITFMCTPLPGYIEGVVNEDNSSP